MSRFAVDVNPAVLRWARETAGYTVPEVAERFRKPEQEIQAWESKGKRLTWSAVGRLAKIYKRPVTSLLLPAPPREEPTPPDFRSLPNAAKKLSPQTRFVIRTARWLARATLELEQQVGIPAVSRGPQAKLSINPENLAEQTRGHLNISLQEQSSWSNPYHALNEWRKALEAQNVLVFQFRMDENIDAFSLLQDNRPVIVLNPSSAPARRIFSLFHEYAHILLKHPGICLPQEGLGSPSQQIETYCNRFSAALLVPRRDLAENMPEISDEESFKDTARRYRVSRLVILGRMATMGAISPQNYIQLARRWQARAQAARPREVTGGPSAVTRCLSERGRRLASLVVEAMKRDLISANDATTYLGIKVPDLRKLEAKVS